MPNSPNNSNLSGSLRSYLEGILPDTRLSEVTVDPKYQPILLLQTKRIVAAFAFSDNDLRDSYEGLYGSFKSYYAKKQGEWDTLDLAFVFCVQPEMPDLDRFCSKIETDVYFCRKFVVLLVQPLGESLSRLPFLPLSPLNGLSMRPASAQTFLQQCTVPAALARFIVVQRERSPEGIVEDCISGKFGEPRGLALVKNTQFVQPDRDIEPVRLETVTISNFRAYRKQQTFEIGSDITVLYGPNGFGKTSFFDAIDFAVTGGIGRFESPNDAHFMKTAQHLDCGSEESVVSVSFMRNSVVRKVTRSVGDRKQALLDGLPTDRKSILTELTSGSIPAADRVENFVNLFRATHLFSQEHQELTRGFQNDCRLSTEIVSRMLAFEDYVNAVNKASRVREVLQAEISKANKEIRELSEQIINEKIELERLGQTINAHTSIDALDAEISVLQGKVVVLGIPVPHQKPDAAIVRGWRASLEARYADCQSRIERLYSLTKEAAGLQQTRAAFASLQQQLAQKEQMFGLVEEKRTAAEGGLQLAEQRLAEMNVKYAEVQAHADLFEWVRIARPVYVQLIAKYNLLNDELIHSTESLDELRTTEEKGAGELRAKKNIAGLFVERLTAKRAEFGRLHSLNESFDSWLVNNTRLATIGTLEQSVAKSLELLRAEERTLSLQVTAAAEEEARLSRHITEVDKSQSELKNLLSQMQGYIRSGTCPLCGEDHGSKDELVHRIQKHVDSDAASSARAEITCVLERARQLTEQVAGNKQKQHAASTQLIDLKKERATLDTEIDQFANSAINLGITLDASGPPPVEQLQARKNLLGQEVEELSRQIQESVVAEEEASTALANTKALVAASVATITYQKTAIAQLQKETNQLRSDPRQIQVSLDIDDERLMEFERLNRVHLPEIKAEVVQVQAEVVQQKTAMGALRQESHSLKAQIAALRAHSLSLQNTMAQITARLEESKLTVDASEEVLLSLIAEESRTQAQIHSLRESVRNPFYLDSKSGIDWTLNPV